MLLAGNRNATDLRHINSSRDGISKNAINRLYPHSGVRFGDTFSQPLDSAVLRVIVRQVGIVIDRININDFLSREVNDDKFGTLGRNIQPGE